MAENSWLIRRGVGLLDFCDPEKRAFKEFLESAGYLDVYEKCRKITGTGE